MMTEAALTIPTDPDFLCNLILQRTGPFEELGGLPALQHWFATGETAQLHEFLLQNRLVGTFIERVLDSVRHDLDDLFRLVPESSFANIVSVGPGNGILEAAICRRARVGKILLVDIERSEGLHQHGFASSGSGYASLGRTREFMIQNGIPADRIALCNPLREPLPPFRFDLLFSILSMGFHYPCDEYADYIAANAGRGAFVVLDKRNDASARKPGLVRAIRRLLKRQPVAADAGYERLLELMRVHGEIEYPKYSRTALLAA